MCLAPDPYPPPPEIKGTGAPNCYHHLLPLVHHPLGSPRPLYYRETSTAVTSSRQAEGPRARPGHVGSALLATLLLIRRSQTVTEGWAILERPGPKAAHAETLRRVPLYGRLTFHGDQSSTSSQVGDSRAEVRVWLL